jgi:hypothetical protein
VSRCTQNLSAAYFSFYLTNNLNVSGRKRKEKAFSSFTFSTLCGVFRNCKYKQAHEYKYTWKKRNAFFSPIFTMYTLCSFLLFIQVGGIFPTKLLSSLIFTFTSTSFFRSLTYKRCFLCWVFKKIERKTKQFQRSFKKFLKLRFCKKKS